MRSVFQGVRVAGRVVRTRTRPRRATGTTGTAVADGGDDDCTVVGVCDSVHVRTVQQKVHVEIATVRAHRQQLFRRR